MANRSWLRRRKTSWPFVGGMAVAAALYLGTDTISAVIGAWNHFVLPESSPATGGEWARLYQLHPDGSPDLYDGTARWSVVPTSAGASVRGSAMLLDRGILMELTIAPVAAPADAAYEVTVTFDVPRAFGTLRDVIVQASPRRVTKASELPGTIVPRSDDGVRFEVSAADRDGFEAALRTAEALGVVALFHREGENNRELDVYLLLGATGRAALAEAFGI